MRSATTLIATSFVRTKKAIDKIAVGTRCFNSHNVSWDARWQVFTKWQKQVANEGKQNFARWNNYCFSCTMLLDIYFNASGLLW